MEGGCERKREERKVLMYNYRDLGSSFGLIYRQLHLTTLLSILTFQNKNCIHRLHPLKKKIDK